MRLEDFTLNSNEDAYIKKLKEGAYKEIIKQNVKKLIEAQNALVVRGQKVHDAIMKADERLSMSRAEESNFFKNFFKTYSGLELPNEINDSTDTEILVQLNKYAVDMKDKGYKEFEIPMF